MRNTCKKSFMSSLVNFSPEIVLKIGSVVKRKFAYFSAIKTVCLPWKDLISSVRSKICKYFSMKRFRLPSFYFSTFFPFFVIYDSIVICFYFMKKSKNNVQFIIIRKVGENERKRVVWRKTLRMLSEPRLMKEQSTYFILLHHWSGWQNVGRARREKGNPFAGQRPSTTYFVKGKHWFNRRPTNVLSRSLWRGHYSIRISTGFPARFLFLQQEQMLSAREIPSDWKSCSFCFNEIIERIMF